MKINTKYIIIIILSILAFVNSFYLAYDWLFPVEIIINPYIQLWNITQVWWTFCDINDTFSCSKVMNSEYSKLFWIPVSIFGMLNFFAIWILSMIWIFRKNTDIIKILLIMTSFWVLFNFYLFYLEIFVIKAFCPVCIAISISLFSIFFISLYSVLKCTTKQ